MKVAVPSEDGVFLSQHFGRTPGFAIFEVADGNIVKREYRTNTFTGHVTEQHHGMGNHEEHDADHAVRTHGRILAALGDCDVVIAGGMGRRLFEDFSDHGKRIYITTQIEVKKAVELFLADELSSDKPACRGHQ